jgi:hypothetical protein
LKGSTTGALCLCLENVQAVSHSLVPGGTFSILKSLLSFAPPTLLVTSTLAWLAWAQSKNWDCIPSVFHLNCSQRGTFLSYICSQFLLNCVQ